LRHPAVATLDSIEHVFCCRGANVMAIRHFSDGLESSEGVSGHEKSWD
jgi:hypothetical protein